MTGSLRHRFGRDLAGCAQLLLGPVGIGLGRGMDDGERSLVVEACARRGELRETDRQVELLAHLSAPATKFDNGVADRA